MTSHYKLHKTVSKSVGPVSGRVISHALKKANVEEKGHYTQEEMDALIPKLIAGLEIIIGYSECMKLEESLKRLQ